jgi:cation diffusion facilitator CzcD-associated flavoprotein CzcO
MSDHVDVVIMGAGISGIGAACHLQRESPGRSFAILEARDAIGGTWDLFRYPGIRSDSDMFTLGYSFRPWEEAKAIADGPSILRYVRETARDHDVERHIRFGHRVVRAKWSSEDALWTVTAERDGEEVELTCSFFFGCSGYYRYDEGYSPELEGLERFGGTVVHPQHWPEDLDYAGKRVVVIGSGATAVTLVPAMAEQAAHVTMLQRSPTYILSLPSRDRLADSLRRRLPARRAYSIIRWKNVLLQQLSYGISRRWPGFARRMIRRGLLRELPPDYEIDTHFNPSYAPWDQRLCLVPDGDLFKALASGDASIVTDRIATFTETGIRLESGEELEADVVVTATGLNLLALGGVELSVDGREIEVGETVGYKGMMLSGVPNLAIALGYTNASWTLKCDLVAEYVCRLLNHMRDRGYDWCVPLEPPPGVRREPFLDLQAGYVMRSIDQLPRQGERTPWRLHQNYARDILMLRRGEVEDEGIDFGRRPEAVGAAEPEAASAGVSA